MGNGDIGVMNCLGIPIEYDPASRVIACSRWWGAWAQIVVSPGFMRFHPRERTALLLHEAAHCRMLHVKQRLVSLWLLLWSPAALAELCRQQEFEADAFVARLGFGPDLAAALLRIDSLPSPFHPPKEQRIDRLLRI
jgi:Zn-dependent protease with chaperone function